VEYATPRRSAAALTVRSVIRLLPSRIRPESYHQESTSEGETRQEGLAVSSLDVPVFGESPHIPASCVEQLEPL
jgi:hypothetical protein